MKHLFLITTLLFATPMIIRAEGTKPNGEVVLYHDFIAPARYQLTVLAHEETDVYLKLFPKKGNNLNVLIKHSNQKVVYRKYNRKRENCMDSNRACTIRIDSSEDPVLLVSIRKMYQLLKHTGLLILKWLKNIFFWYV